MSDSPYEVISSPGNLSDSEVNILSDYQSDVRNLLNEIKEKESRILKLKSQLEEAINSKRRLSSFGDLFLVGIVGVLGGFLLSFLTIAQYSYDSGVSDGIKYKKELCQIKHPKNASAYQDCLDSN